MNWAWAQAESRADDLDFLFEEPQAPEPRATANSPATPAPAQKRADSEPTDAPDLSADDAPAKPPAEASSRRRPAGSRAIEEIVVTAQKREQTVQDVPISLSVLTGDFLVEQGVNDLATALLFVPNVKITSAGFFAAPNARGFTFNNNNKAFEPPLGLAIDGIPYTRIPYFLAATFDLKRIEVLRGPQGTTFGKNTTAGLIHIITNDPTDEFTASLSAQAGELDRRRVEAAFSGPLLRDVVNFRIAGFSDEREGFVSNTSDAVAPDANRRFLGHDRIGLRAKLDFVDIFGSQLRLSYEDITLDDFGTGLEIIRAAPPVRAFLRFYDPNTDFEQGNNLASLDAPDERRVGIETYRAEWNYDLAGWGLVALGGYSVLDNALLADIDFTPAPALVGAGGDRSPTQTYELRVVSPRLDGFFGLDSIFGLNPGTSDFVAGAFFQHREINDSLLRTTIDVPSFLGLTVAAEGGNMLPDALTGPVADALNLNQPLLAPVLSSLAGVLVEDISQNFDQQADSLAFFAEFQWHFLPSWTVQLGMRYGTEDKQAAWSQTFNQPQPALVAPLAGFEEFQAEREITEDQFQHKVSLNWQPTDSISLFVHRAEAVKGGGFNAFAFRNVNRELEYDPEFTTEWAFNAKTNWLGGTLNANIGVYRMDVEDFQVLVRDTSGAVIGLGTSLVTNAAEARAQGVEGDLQWLVTRWLTLLGTIGYNDTEYLNFTMNECPADRPMDGGCDATGQAFPFTPEWNNTLTALTRFPLPNSGLEITGSATIEQFSEQFLDVDLDQRKVQEGFERYKAGIGIGNPEQGWSFKLVGENLTNERSGVRQGDLSPGLFVEITEQPRLFYGQFTWRYQ